MGLEPCQSHMRRLAGQGLETNGTQQGHDLPGHRALEWLDALAETWQKTDLVEEKSDVIHAVYERIVIEGLRFVGFRLTPAACGMDWPSRCQRLFWRARQESDVPVHTQQSA